MKMRPAVWFQPHTQRTACKAQKRRLLMEALESRRLMAFDMEPEIAGTVGPAEVKGSTLISWKGEQVEVNPGSWIVSLDNASSVDVVQPLKHAIGKLGRFGDFAVEKKWLGNEHQIAIQTDPRVPFETILETASSLPGFRYAEPDFMLHASATVPSDPQVGAMYGLERISAFDAWDLHTGSSSVVVGVIDSGIDYSHPDLVSNMWVNTREIPGDGIDNDRNGYRDDVYGYDFVNSDGDPMDDNGHGTHVAGTISAAGNNGVGVAGVSWNSKVMALKFLGSNGSGPISAAVSALNYATMMKNTQGVNIRITNNSWGGGAFSQAMSDALTANANAGMLFVASAGNAASNNDTTTQYPATYPHANIISVASTDSSDLLSSFSNYGLTTVDIAAPGSSILSTARGGGYVTLSGTSMASPHISGAAAMLWGVMPQAGFAQVRDLLYQTGDPLTSLTGKTLTGKRLNVASAVRSSLGDVGDTLSTSRLTKLDQPGDQFVVPSGRIGDGLHASSDVDLYQVQASAGDVLSVALSTPQGGTAVNTVLRIFNSQGVQLASLDDPDSNGAQYQLAVSTSGTYYLGVSGGQNSLYNPALSNSGSNGAVGDYRLDVSLDVGDTLSSAKVLTLGTAGTAWQYGAELGDGAFGTKDVDIYRVQLQSQTLFTAYTTPIRAGDAADQVLRLFDANGNLVASSNLANASAVGLQYQIAAGGVFFVGVSGKGNVSYNPTQAGSGTEGIKGDYSLYIESSPLQPSNAAEFNLQSLISADGSQGFVMTGGAPYAELTGGNSVGDVNNDGIDDFVVAVTGDIGIGPKGMVYVVFGKNQQQGIFPSSLDLESLDGTNGYRMEGIELFDRTGLVNGNAGDVNGDGRSDFVIGAIAASPSTDRIDAGQTYVIFGGGLQALDAADGLVDGHILLTNLDGIHGFTINSAIAGGLGGRSATAGDVNGDGFGDLIIGAPAVNSSTGAAYVVFGRSSFPSVFELSSLNGTNGFSIPGLATNSLLGAVVGRAGDINGDSLDDFYVGSPSVDLPGLDNAGATYIIFGKSSFGSAGTPAALDLNTIQGTNGFVIQGSTASESFASSVSFAGDFNADGFGDLAIAASGADFEGRSNAGAVYMIYGRNASQNPFPSVILSNTIESAHGIAIVGAYAEGFMAAVGSGGDVNGDGFSDMIMAAASADPFGIANAGQTFVVYGSRLTPSRFDLATLLNANGGNGTFGRVFNGFLDGSGMRASIVGDINDDGRDDIRIASPYVDLLGMTAPGQVYMVYGQPSSAGIRVSPSSSMSTSEAGATASFQVVLMTKPSAPVTIPLSVSDGTEGVLSQPSLTFDPSNWNVPQTVVVQGVDDTIVDGPIVYSVVLGIVSSADPMYQGINPSDATITNIDNDFYSTKFYTVDDGTLNQTTEYAFNGSSLDRYSLASANSAPRGATTNGAGSRVWVIDNNRTVYVYDPSGALLGSWSAGSMPNNAQPEGIATNGTDIWIVDNRNDRVYRYTGAATRLSGSQTAASSFALASGNSNPKDIATDGQSLWVVNDATTDRVYKYSVGGTSQGNWSIDSGNSLPTGIAIDPANVNDLWIADRGTNRIYRYLGATTRISGSQTSSSTVQLAASNTSLQGLVVAPGVLDGQAAAEGLVESATSVDASIEWLASVGVPSFDPAIGQKEGFDRSSLLGETQMEREEREVSSIVAANAIAATQMASPTNIASLVSHVRPFKVNARDIVFQSVLADVLETDLDLGLDPFGVE